MPEIIVEDGGWGLSRLIDIQTIAAATAESFRNAAGIDVADPIIIRHAAHPMGPRVLLRRGPSNEHIVLLATRDRHWAQLVFQFAHEYCHVFTAHDRVPVHHRFAWFEESLCELASLFAILRMAIVWQTLPPYVHWKSYGASLAAYANKRLSEIEPIDTSEAFHRWLRQNLEQLTNDSTHRKLNLVVAARLLPYFLRHPMTWSSTLWLNVAPQLRGDLAEYFASWRAATPVDHVASVDAIALRLGVRQRPAKSI